MDSGILIWLSDVRRICHPTPNPRETINVSQYYQILCGGHARKCPRTACALVGHTFEDNTTEWQQKGTHRIDQTIRLVRRMADKNKLRCASHKLYFYISYSQSQCIQWIKHLWPQGALTLFGGVGFIARDLRCPKKENADGARGIFGSACRVGLRPCDRNHLKNGLVPYSYAGGA